MGLGQTFPNYRQLDRMDCGPTCVQIIAKHFGAEVSRESIREWTGLQKGGTSYLGLIHALKNLGISALAVSADFQELEKELPLPLIAHWEGNHFVVVFKVTKRYIFVSDPAMGISSYTHKEFQQKWSPKGKGVALLVENTTILPTKNGKEKISGRVYLWTYIRPFKRYLGQLGLGLFLALAIQLVLPFLTQALVDTGIAYQDLSFIHLILLAYGFLFVIRLASELLRDGLLLQLSNRIQIRMVSDFLERLLVMPMVYFDRKTTGDFMQRIHDHQHIDDFLGGNALSIVFDLFSLLAFGTVLGIFDAQILLIFSVGTLFFFLWSVMLLPQKERLDHLRFENQRKGQSLLLQMILAVQDIKLNGSRTRRISEWKANRGRLFVLENKFLRLDQAQMKGEP